MATLRILSGAIGIALLGTAVATGCSSSTNIVSGSGGSAAAGTGGTATGGNGGSSPDASAGGSGGATGGSGGATGGSGGQDAGPDGSGGTAGSAGADAGPAMIQIKGTVRFLQSGSLTLQDNGADDLTVTKDGTFTFATPVADGGNYAVTISANTSGQLCTVRGGTGTGTASAANPPDVQIVCVVAESSRSSDAAGQTTTSTTYEDFNALTPLSVNVTGGPVKALVSLFVPWLDGDGNASTQNVLGQAWLGIDVDGTVVSDAVNQAAYWGNASPTTALAVITLPNGAHTVKAVWRHVDASGNGTGQSTAGPDISTVSGASALDEHSNLSLTVLDSLDSYAGFSVAKGNASGTTTSTSFVDTKLPSIAPAPSVATPTLVTAVFPSVYNSATSPTGNTFFQLSAGGNVISNASFIRDASRDGIALLGMTPLNGSTTINTQWRIDTGKGVIENSPAQISAIMFKPASNILSKRTTGSASTSSQTYSAIPGLGGTLNLAGPRTVLYALQLDRVWIGGNGYQSYVSVFIDGKAQSTTDVQSQNSNMPQMVTIVGMAKLTAGSHTVSAQFRVNSGSTVTTGIDAKSIANLVAIPLE